MFFFSKLKGNPIFLAYALKRHKSTRDSHSSCWNCKKKHFETFLICGNCHFLQDPYQSIYKLSYFQLFEITPQFSIDLKDLDKKYKDLQMSFHPDRMKNKEKNMMQYSQSYSSYINEAYQTLKNDFKRALYILQLEGFVEDNEKRIQKEEYLEKILEIREEIEESCGEELSRIKSQNDKNKNNLMQNLKEKLDKKDFGTALDEIFKLRYLLSVEEAIFSRQDKLSN